MSSRSEVLTIEHSLPSERLDTYLRGKFPAVSRGAIQRLIEQGHIRVNGRIVKPTHAPRAGEQVEVHWPEARPAEAQPEEIPLDILYEDDALLVLNKPPGLVVHPAAGPRRAHARQRPAAPLRGPVERHRRRRAPGHRPPPRQGNQRLPGRGQERRDAPGALRPVRHPQSGEDLPRHRLRRAAARPGRNPRRHCPASLPSQAHGGGRRRWARGADQLPRAGAAARRDAGRGASCTPAARTRSASISSSSASRWWATRPTATGRTSAWRS